MLNAAVEDEDLNGVWGGAPTAEAAPRLRLVAGGSRSAPPEPPDFGILETVIACFALAVIGMAVGHFLVPAYLLKDLVP